MKVNITLDANSIDSGVKLFDEHPELYFSADRFHPSALGYQACAEAMLPEVLQAVGAVSGGSGPARAALPASP